MENRIPLPRLGVLLLCLIGASSGCYHTHLITGGNRANSSPFRATLSSSRVVPAVAGLPASAGCPANGLNHVHVYSTLGHALGTVFSFGKWAHVQVEWECATSKSRVGPALPSAPTPRVEPTGAPAPTASHTNTRINRWLWGILQSDLTPPANPQKKNPANCKSDSMRQVTVPKNYGYSLATVLTLGIWAPIEVEWQCGGDGSDKNATL